MSTEAEKAYEFAQMQIRGLKANETSRLDIGISALKEIPAEISDLSWLAELNLSDTNITDLSLLAKLPHLQELELSNSGVKNISYLKKCTSLKRLTINDTQICDISALSELSALEEIFLINTSVEDLTALSHSKSLRLLIAARTLIRNLEPLTNLRNLRYLSAANTKVSDLSPLIYHTNLQTLILNDTQVSDITPISSLTQLQTLDVTGTKVFDLRPIRSIPALKAAFPKSNLSFAKTPATKIDGELLRLSSIETMHDRSRQTLDYLNTLGNDWPPGSSVTDDRPGAPAYTMPQDGGPVRAMEEAPEGWDDAQHELHQEVQEKAARLIRIIGPDSNQYRDLRQVAEHYLDRAAKEPTEIGIRGLWSSGNTLRQELKAHEKAEQQGREVDELPPRIAAALTDFMQTHGVFIMGFPNAKALEMQHRDYISGAATSAESSIVLDAARALTDALHGRNDVLAPMELATLADDRHAAAIDGPDGDMARNSLFDRLNNIVGAIGRGLWIMVKRTGALAGAGIIGHYATQFVVANEALILNFLTAVDTTAAWWFPHLVTALRAMFGL